MAGIKSALKRVLDKKHIGFVRAMGTLEKSSLIKKGSVIGECRDADKCMELNPKFAIIELEDRGHITVYDYGSDIMIDNDLKCGDPCELQITSNYSAKWCKRHVSKSPVENVEETK